MNKLNVDKMKKKNKFKALLLLTGLCLVITMAVSCSDNSAGPDDGPGGKGQASFTISGAVSGQKTGVAEFYNFSAFGIHTWTIDIYDLGPSTYELSLFKVSNSPISNPAPGSYDLGNDLFTNDGFVATYTDGVGPNSTEYSPILSALCPGVSEDEGGTLIIESSNNDRIKGSFSFKGSDFDFDDNGNCVVLGTVTVSGQFNATKTNLD